MDQTQLKQLEETFKKGFRTAGDFTDAEVESAWQDYLDALPIDSKPPRPPKIVDRIPPEA